MERDIIATWLYPQPPTQVWECLTNPELLSLWLMPNDFKAEVGHQFRFTSKPKVPIGWDGMVYGEVLEVIPRQRLVYRWKGGPRPGEITLDTVLIWTLTPKNGGTELRLEHKGFKGMKNYLSGFIMEKGWKGRIAQRFSNVLNQLAI
jgi:uncharacterized protein YndB with AHSA1/START domain